MLKYILYATAEIYNVVLKENFAGKTEKDIKRVILSAYKDRLGKFTFKDNLSDGEMEIIYSDSANVDIQSDVKVN